MTLPIVVVGGGVAGLSALLALARRGPALLLEREAALCAHASGRNAAIYRPLEDDETSAALARRSLALLAELGAEVFGRCGLVLASARPEDIDAWAARALRQGVGAERLESASLAEIASTLEGGDARAGLFVPSAGVLEVERMTRALAHGARAQGAAIRTGAGVARVVVERGRVQGVELESGERIAASAVVLAAGAWGAALGAACGAPLPLTPLRRHLVELELAAALPAGHPVVWRLDGELYYRPQTGGVLASPCDDIPWPAGAPSVDPAAASRLIESLRRLAPSLANARVRELRACLRTFASDRELVVGEDPRIAGLHWFAGLGGRGMAVAPAAGEVLAAIVAGEDPPFAHRMAPRRLVNAAAALRPSTSDPDRGR